MAGIHEIVRETPKPKRPAPIPGELLAQLRQRVTHFEQLAAKNRQRMNQIESCLSELTRSAELSECSVG
jgi:hypothetical protein